MPRRRFRLSALAVLLLAAFALRVWKLDGLAVEHFDEGVYASNLFSGLQGHRFPHQHLYSPPLFPALLEWTLILSGGETQAVMWVNLLLGTLLVGAVWWTTRELAQSIIRTGNPAASANETETFSESAALAAAALVAFSDLMIQYSRAALTDIPVCLWITLAVGAGARGLRTGHPGWLGGAALATALGWWTKYNGWLPLAILGAGVAGWTVWNRLFTDRTGKPEQAKRRTVSAKQQKRQLEREGAASPVTIGLRWLLIAIAAFLLWLPCLWGLSEFGGYTAVARNHAGYVVGLTGWFGSLTKHLAVDRHYASLVGLAGTVCAVGLALFRFTWKQADPESADSLSPLRLRIAQGVGLAVALGAVQLALGLMPVLLLLIVLGLVSSREQQPEPTTGLSALAFWIVAAWLIGLAVTTPLYRPYPRLILPWLTGGMIGAGIGLAWLAKRLAHGTDSRYEPALNGPALEQRKRRLLLIAIPLSLAACAALAGLHPPAWQDRTGMARAAPTITDWIIHDLPRRPASTIPEADFVVYVLAEPGLYFHLSAQTPEPHRMMILPAADLGMIQPGQTDPRLPAYLVTGPHALEEASRLADETDRVRQIAALGEQASDLVLLDDVLPSELMDQRRQGIQVWVLNNR